MAILQSTGIRGFLVSVKKTGNKVVNSIGKTIDEYTENFLSGFAGHGWKLWEYISGKYKLEIDALMVRGTFTVFELLVQKIRSIKGALGITQGNGKIKTVTLSQDGTEYLITLEDEMSFKTDDFIKCQTFTGVFVKLYHVKVQSISDSNSVIHLLVSDFEKDENGTVLNPPEPGDEIVQFGNETDTTRQSAIYIHADEGGQPAIDVMFGINSTDWSNTVKIRVGGEIPDSGGLRGFYCVNGMIKGVTESGHVTYCIYPDGSAMFGDGSAEFRADKSGYLAGGAIRWQWDEEKQKFVTSMQALEIRNGEIVIKKDDGTVTAGMSGAGAGATGYRMWSGGISGDAAFNRWAEDGSGRVANGAIEWDANGLTKNMSTPVYSWRNLPDVNSGYIQDLLPYQGTYISIPAGVFSSYKIVLPSPDDNPGMKLIFMQILPPGRSIPINPPAISCSVYGALKVFLSPNIHPGDSAVNKITSLSAGRIYEFISIPAQTYLGIGYAWYIRDDTGMTFAYE